MAPRRLIFLLAVALALPLAAAGCGEDVPEGAVAKIDDTVIEQAEFDHWMNAAARGQQPPGEDGEVAVPDPPEYTQCIAAKQEQETPEGAQEPTDEQLREQCEQEYESLKEQVMQFLISAEWIQQEADARDLDVSEEEVRQQFEDQKNQSFPRERDYQEFLESSGQTEEDLLFRVRLDVLSNKVRESVIEGHGEVSDEDARGYYEENQERFSQPERRDLRVVLTRNENRANEAKRALEDGDSWREVAREYSIDEASRTQGGRLPGVAEGQQERAFDEAIFAADRGELTGPVQTQFGWYVFEVTRVTEATQQSFEEAEETIKNLLRSEREQEALDEFVTEFRDSYRDETHCAEEYLIEDCENAPDRAETGPASGGPPQGAPVPGAPQGVPPQGIPEGVPPEAGGGPPGDPHDDAPPPPPPPPPE